MPFSPAFEHHRLIEFGLRARRKPIIAYGLAVAVVALATLLRWALQGVVIEGVPFITYYPAIIIATLVGGIRAGILATILSAMLALYLFLPPVFSLGFTPQAASSLALFLFMSAIDVAIVALLDAFVDRTISQVRNMRILIESAPTGIVVVDDHGVIKLINGSLEKLFGYNRQELVGKTIDILVPATQALEHRKVREEFQRKPEARIMGSGLDLRGRRKDGSEFPVEIGLNPISQSGRTAVLATVIDISDRKKAQQTQKLIIGELQHRTKNLFAVFQAIASRTVEEGKTAREIKATLSGRIQAFAHAYSILADGDWEGAALKTILDRQLAGFGSRVKIDGCDIVLDAKTAQQFSLIVHELATNALKYGSLSAQAGHVSIEGKTIAHDGKEAFLFTWKEMDGPPVIKPARQGFGSIILVDSAKQFAQHVALDYTPTGLCYELRIELNTSPQISTSRIAVAS